MELPEIQLDPRNEWELFEQAQDHIFNVSGGQLGTKNPADPLSFLLEGQVYAGAELLWYINQLPNKLLTRWLSYWGVELDEGLKATGDITLQLAPINSLITIPANSLFSAGDVLFSSLIPVDAPANSSEITVPVEALEIGAEGNVPSYGVQSIVTPLPFVRSATNLTPMMGGRDAMLAEEAITAFLSQARDQILISEQDYRQTALAFLGDSGWMVRVLSNVDPSTGISISGSVAILVSNAKYQAIPTGTLAALDKYLRDRSILSIQPYVIEMGRYDMSIRINATYDPQDDAQLIADNLVASIYTHLASVMGESMNYRDVILMGEDSGCRVITASFNNSAQINTPSLREVLYPKYIEIRLAADKGQYRKDANDIRQLFGSGDEGQIFIYGEGEGDALI